MTDARTSDDPWAHDHYSRFRPPVAMAGGSYKASRLEICILIGSLDISGGTYVILQHALEAHQRGEHVVLVPLFPPTAETTDWHPALRELRIATMEEVADHEFDLVMATWWRTVYQLHTLRAKRYVYFVQSAEPRFHVLDRPRFSELAAQTYELPLSVITISPWIQAYLGLEFNRPSMVVPNGIDKQRFSPMGPAFEARSDRSLRVLVEGPIEVPMKEIPETIEAVKESKAGELWLLTSSSIEDYPGVDRVFSRVPIDVTPGIYRSCDVLVKLSRVEGMFGPPLEMMHCGGTSVVWDVTGHEDYLTHDENALIAPTGDYRAVTDALDRLANDRALTTRLSTAGLKTAARWPGWETSSAAFHRRLQVLGRHPQPPEQIETIQRTSEQGANELR